MSEFMSLDEWGAEKSPSAPRTLRVVQLFTDPSPTVYKAIALTGRRPDSIQVLDNTESSKSPLRFS